MRLLILPLLLLGAGGLAGVFVLGMGLLPLFVGRVVLICVFGGLLIAAVIRALTGAGNILRHRRGMIAVAVGIAVVGLLMASRDGEVSRGARRDMMRGRRSVSPSRRPSPLATRQRGPIHDAADPDVERPPTPPAQSPVARRIPFLADVYPSAAQAVEALATEARGSLAAVAPPDATRFDLVVAGSAPRKLLEAVADALRRDPLVVSVRFEVQDETAATQPGTTWGTTQPVDGLTIRMVCALDVAAAPGGPADTGTARLEVTGPSGQFTCRTSYVDKPWAASLSTFVARSPDTTWLLAVSPHPAATADEAGILAQREAVRQLTPYVHQQVRGLASRMNADILQQEIRSSLHDGLIADRFVQRFRRPYGDTWRASLLVEVAPAAIADIVARAGAESAARRSRTIAGVIELGLWVGAAVLAATLVYLLANAATKGYYAWPLRIGIFGLLVVATVALLLIA